jgi:hypothetical protein
LLFLLFLLVDRYSWYLKYQLAFEVPLHCVIEEHRQANST